MSAQPIETHLAECQGIHATGANAPETSFYAALSTPRSTGLKFWKLERTPAVTRRRHA